MLSQTDGGDDYVLKAENEARSLQDGPFSDGSYRYGTDWNGVPTINVAPGTALKIAPSSQTTTLMV